MFYYHAQGPTPLPELQDDGQDKATIHPLRIYIANNWNSGRLAIAKTSDSIGLMFTPSDYNKSWYGPHALDNGAYSAFINGVSWDSAAFIRVLQKVPKPDFAVIPDIVAAGKKSLQHSLTWREFLPDSINWYLAVQDGMTPRMIPDMQGGIFVGGSMDWKLATAAEWVQYAHDHSLQCHIGRIGTLRGLMWAERIGADSVDSSNFAKHQKNWNELLQFLKGEHRPMEEYLEC